MRIAFFLLLLALGASHAQALEVPITLENRGATITVTSCFDPPPTENYAPLEITINNFSGTPQKWTFRFSSSSFGRTSMDSEVAVTVENNATRTQPILVPITPRSDANSWLEPLRVTVHGYGTETGVTQTIGRPPSSGKPFTPYIVISNQLGTKFWSQLDAALDSKNHQLRGSLVDPTQLPEDWRGLSGVRAMWLAPGEIDQLSATQRDALRSWVHLGGVLTICGGKDLPEDFRTGGFGEVKIAGGTLSLFDAEAAIKELPNRTEIAQRLQFISPQIGQIAPHATLLICVMALFAALVGPINVFYFARKNNRHRLFWTTPLISVGMSILLLAFIFLQDGLGGSGERTIFALVLPHEHSEVVWQKQTSRTGLLLSSSFQTRDPVVIDQINSNDHLNVRACNLENNDTAFSGDWFTSRTVQTQLIQSVLPTRGEITLVNASGSPVVLSSFAAPLDKLVYFDAQDRCWSGTDLQAGEKKALVPAAADRIFPRSLRFRDEPGSFLASSHDASACIPTLPSIRWRENSVYYFGQVTTP